eukprot:CAMPEP_0203761386 /NCGR_PEP_ID=MMETSP0098-20131031/14489_1 /ASSEMBLY_ACC=CAM_ASM_000208 /TAXON_ID=96639 /ORGANISM=" , Strain NY0313808BC1" /LENGTH=1281 /DNA_ID=CAMNT_0050655367 /DNA_START=259 /DNA_END=4101 /DNA_ORIENTATION=-
MVNKDKPEDDVAVSDSDAESEDEEEDEEDDSLMIPVRDRNGNETDQMINFPLNNLPAVHKVLKCLKSELAALHRWLSFAVEFYRQGRVEEFTQILEEGCSADVEKYYEHDKEGRLNLLNAYAAYKISLAQTSAGGSAATHLTEVVELFNRADRIDDTKGITWVNKGVLSLVQGEDDNALHHFENALELDPGNLLAKLGRGAMLFKNRKFKEARDQYKRAIREHPGCSASVRVNLGLCFYELGYESRAVECFTRALEIDEDDANALVALSVIELGRAQQQNFDLKMSQRAMQRLRRAYELQPTNAMVLIHLANHFFCRRENQDRDYSRIESLARKAYKNTTLEQIRAESAYIIGRNFHEQGELSEAREFYDRSLKHWPGFTLAQFAKAQMHLVRSEKTLATTSRNAEKEAKRKETIEQTRLKALRILEKILNDPMYKNDRDTSMFAAWVHLRMNRREPAMNLLKQVTSNYPGDTEAWLEQARVIQKETTMTKKQKRDSLRAYNKAASGMRPIPPFLFNNVGELKFSLNDVRGALQAFRGGLEQQKEKLDKFDEVTLKYNLARVLEEMGEFDEAEGIYKGLNSDLGQYSEPLLRLGAMEERHGRLKEAEEFYTKATTTETNPSDAWILLGRLEQKRKNGKKAREHFTKLSKGDKNVIDPYARLSIANIMFDKARQNKPASNEFKEGMSYAKGWYRRVLERNHGNVYAANGLANVLAIQDFRKDAKQIYERLREPDDAANPSVWINLAHLAIEDGRYDTAVSLYQQCIKRFNMQTDADLLLFLANAYIYMGKFNESKAALLRAIRIDPSNIQLRFNLSILLLQQGVDICDKAEERNLKSMLKAVEGFKLSKEMFEWLIATKTTSGESVATGGASSGNVTTKFLQEPSSPRGSPPEANKKYFELWQKSKDVPEAREAAVDSISNATEERTSSSRSLFERAPRSSVTQHIKLSKQRLDAVVSVIAGSKKLVQFEQNREMKTKQQLESMASRNMDIERDLEQKRIADAERIQREKDENERRAREQIEKSQNLAKEFVNARVLQEQQKKEKKVKAKKKGAKGKKKDDFVNDEIEEEQSSVGSLGTSDESSVDGDGGDRDFNVEDERKKRKRNEGGSKKKKKSSKKKKRLSKKQSDSSEENEGKVIASDEEMELFGDDDDEDDKKEDVKEGEDEAPTAKSASRVVASDDDEEGEVAPTTSKKSKVIASDDEEDEEEAEPTSSKKSKVIASDDEEEGEVAPASSKKSKIVASDDDEEETEAAPTASKKSKVLQSDDEEDEPATKKAKIDE